VNLRRILGARGETLAARYLRKTAGHRILKKNYRSAAGEIDLVCADGDTLVFVEVKTRASDELADPLDSVDRAKRAQIERAARHFAMNHRVAHLPMRFDVVRVVWPPRGAAVIEHFPDAFPARRG
jgi:putative endonuclease